MTNPPHTCGPDCAMPCPNAQLELRFDLTDASRPFRERVRALVAPLRSSMGLPLRSLDAELAECPQCGGAGEVFIDRADHRGEHVTEHRPCADCCTSDDAALDTWSELRAEISA